jgi:hypothetical protein
LLAEERVEKTIRTLELYVLAHLGEVCLDFSQIQSDITDEIQHPGRHAKGLSFSEIVKLRDQRLAYIEKILADLRSVKSPDKGGS